MVVRLSDIRAKTGKKCIFCVFRLFLPLCRTASWPYRLSYINALCINQSYWHNFSQKNFEGWLFWKKAILKIGHFGFFFLKRLFFLLHPNKNQSQIMWRNGLDSILMFSLVFRKFLTMRNITLYSVTNFSSLKQKLYTQFCNSHKSLGDWTN